MIFLIIGAPFLGSVSEANAFQLCSHQEMIEISAPQLQSRQEMERQRMIRLMEEIPNNHLGCLKPYK